MNKKAGNKAVSEPYKSANQTWYENALQEFWRKFERGMVEENANDPYKSKNKGKGLTRGENAKILVSYCEMVSRRRQKQIQCPCPSWSAKKYRIITCCVMELPAFSWPPVSSQSTVKPVRRR